jgi:hypothetical protein
MPTAVWTAIISGLFGLATGSGATAWVQWGIEKRRLKLQRRYDLLDSWRTGIASIEPGNPQDFVVRQRWCVTLSPYLSDAGRARLENPRTVIVPSDSAGGLKDLFTGEVERIEREWGLRL